MTLNDVAVAVIFDDDRVLMQKRDDFRVWGLPGGMIEDGEAPSTAAAREAHEETGYTIQVTRPVGRYVRPQVGNTVHAFEGVITGGDLVRRGPETLDVDWFPVDDLPKYLSPTTDRYIADARANLPQPVWETVKFPPIMIVLWRIGVFLRGIRNRLFR